MTKRLLFRLPVYLFLVFVCQVSFAQNASVDYTAWNPTSPPCNIFGAAPNVPATVGGAASTIKHSTLIGQPGYDVTAKCVFLPVQYISTPPTTNGSSFKLAYSFKKGYRYMITINACAATGTTGTPNGPWLRADLNNNGPTSSACSGAQSINYNVSGNPAPYQILTTAFADYQYVFNSAGYYSSTFNELDISGIPSNAASNANSIKIKKITISESLVPPVFTLSPSSVSRVCGQSASQVFTVNNTTSTPNVTNYVWSLGATPNGWLYNGNPAPATISTATNTLTLVPVCAGTQKPVSVTVTATGGNYATNSVATTVTQPSYGISGPLTFCTTTQQYSVTSLPCNATVTWVSSNTSVATVTTLNNVGTLTKMGSGGIRLTANITTACGNTARFVDIAIGAPVAPTITYVKESGTTTSYIFTASSSGPPVGYDWYVNGVRTRVNADGVTYLEIPCNQNRTVKCNQTNSCGTSAFSSDVFVLNSCPPAFAVSPNPASQTISVESAAGTQKTKSSGATGTIQRLSLYDQSGNLKKQWTFSNGNSKVQINVSQIPRGNYFLEIVSDGGKDRHQIILK